MASFYKEIRAALEKHLVTLSGLPEIAWENVPFEPTTGTPWAALRLTPTGRSPAVRGINPQQRYDGLLTIELKYPEGLGPNLADEMADSIMEHFEATTGIVDNDLLIRIETSDRGQGTEDSPWYSVPVIITWYSYKT